MERLRIWLRNWLTREPQKQTSLLAKAIAADSQGVEGADEAAEFRFSIGRAINGKIVTISKFKRNPHGPDWTHQLYLVPEGEDLMDAVKTCMTITALTK